MTVDQRSPHAVSFTKPSDLEFRVERTFDHPIVGDGTRLAITSRFDTTEEPDGLVAYGAEKGAIGGLTSLDALLKRLAAG